MGLFLVGFETNGSLAEILAGSIKHVVLDSFQRNNFYWIPYKPVLFFSFKILRESNSDTSSLTLPKIFSFLKKLFEILNSETQSAQPNHRLLHQDLTNSQPSSTHWPLNLPWRKSKITTPSSSSSISRPTSQRSRLLSRRCTKLKSPRFEPLHITIFRYSQIRAHTGGNRNYIYGVNFYFRLTLWSDQMVPRRHTSNSPLTTMLSMSLTRLALSKFCLLK